MPRYTFVDIFKAFTGLGLNVVPARPDGKWPAIKWSGFGEPGGPRVGEEHILDGMWVLDHAPEMGAFLFPASAAPGYTNLVVVDVDDNTWLDRAKAMAGAETPFTVRTRRGTHLYYRAPLDGREVVSRTAIFGEPGVDIKAWRAGVMAPGSPKGDIVYEPSVPLERITQDFVDALPVFDVDAYERVWAENRPKTLRREQDYARRNPGDFVSVKKRPKVMRGGMQVLGDVKGSKIVTLESTNEEIPISQVPVGEKVYAFNREDHTASGQVWRSTAGDLFYTDWSRNFMWRIVPDDWIPFYDRVKPRPPDPEPQESTLAGSIRSAYPNIRVVELPDEGYLEVDVPEGMTLIRAPHGCGKTELAKRLFDGAHRAISIANTRLLVAANAERFGVPSHMTENAKVSPRAATTINSILKFEVDGELDLLHIDEADQVHGFLHSGKVKNAHACYVRMMDLAASAKRTLITSADLTFDDMSLFIDVVHERNPDKAITVIIREP